MHCDPAKPDDHIVFANLLVHVNSTTICRVKEKKRGRFHQLYKLELEQSGLSNTVL